MQPTLPNPWEAVTLEGEGVRRCFKVQNWSQQPLGSQYVGLGGNLKGGGWQKPEQTITLTEVYCNLLAAPGKTKRQMGLR